jgi:hypothetical protein
VVDSDSKTCGARLHITRDGGGDIHPTRTIWRSGIEERRLAANTSLRKTRVVGANSTGTLSSGVEGPSDALQLSVVVVAQTCATTSTIVTQKRLQIIEKEKENENGEEQTNYFDDISAKK